MGEENHFNQKYYQFILGEGDSPSPLYIVNKVKKFQKSIFKLLKNTGLVKILQNPIGNEAQKLGG